MPLRSVGWNFGSTNIHEAVKLDRIAIHDLTAEGLCEFEGEVALTGPGRSYGSYKRVSIAFNHTFSLGVQPSV